MFSRSLTVRGSVSALDSKLRRFQMLLDIGQEPLGIRAVDDAVIETEREISHMPNRDVILAIRRGQDLCALFDLADPQDCHLRLIDDRRTKQSTKYARICDGERAARDFIGL